MSPATTAILSDLRQAVTDAARAERAHQKRCRARAAGLGCCACLGYERLWLEADDRLADLYRYSGQV